MRLPYPLALADLSERYGRPLPAAGEEVLHKGAAAEKESQDKDASKTGGGEEQDDDEDELEEELSNESQAAEDFLRAARSLLDTALLQDLDPELAILGRVTKMDDPVLARATLKRVSGKLSGYRTGEAGANAWSAVLASSLVNGWGMEGGVALLNEARKTPQPQDPRNGRFVSGRVSASPNTQPRTMAEFEAAKPGTVSPEQAAELMAAEPNHPLSMALREWGDDDQRFTELMSGTHADSENWSRNVRLALEKISPVEDAPTLYRGWNFPTAAARESFMRLVIENGAFEQGRPGMSVSFEEEVTQREKFTRGDAPMIWVIQDNHSARDVRPIFRALETKYPDEEEAVAVRGSSYILERPEPDLREFRDSSGSVRQIPVYFFKENRP